MKKPSPYVLRLIRQRREQDVRARQFVFGSPPKPLHDYALTTPNGSVMNVNNHRIYCAAWCVTVDPFRGPFDGELLTQALEGGIVFG